MDEAPSYYLGILSRLEHQLIEFESILLQTISTQVYMLLLMYGCMLFYKYKPSGVPSFF